MKRELALALLALATFIGLSSMPVLAAPLSFNITGNATDPASYNVTFLTGGVQLNTSIKSSEHAWYNITFNITVNESAAFGAFENHPKEVTGINITLPTSWTDNGSVAYFKLWNRSHLLMNGANGTIVDSNPSYTVVYFNTSNVSYNGSVGNYPPTCGNNTVAVQADGCVFSIIWRIDSLDDHRTVTTTSDDIHKTANATYAGPSGLGLNNTIIYYAPTDWSDIDFINSFNANGTTISKGTSGNTYTMTTTHFKLNQDWNFTAGAFNGSFVKITYTTKEIGHGGTGAGASPPAGIIPVVPVPSTTLGLIVLAIATVIGVGSVAIILAGYYKYGWFR